MTRTQAYYLYYLGVATKRENTVSGLAKRLGVTNASASQRISSMEKDDFIEKDGRNIRLTKHGEEIVRQMREQHSVLVRWMKRNHLSPSKTVSEDAFRYMIEQSPECVEATLKVAKGEEMREISMRHAAACFSGILPDGEYPVPFSVLKGDGVTESMGNRGFHHPGTLVVQEGKGIVLLKAKTIAYQASVGPKLTGRLSSLEYFDGKDYEVLRRPQWFEDWQVPICQPLFEETLRYYKITVKIRARASCGIAHMPRSEALLVMFLEKIFAEK